jgi:hypothetical protein
MLELFILSQLIWCTWRLEWIILLLVIDYSKKKEREICLMDYIRWGPWLLYKISQMITCIYTTLVNAEEGITATYSLSDTSRYWFNWVVFIVTLNWVCGLHIHFVATLTVSLFTTRRICLFKKNKLNNDDCKMLNSCRIHPSIFQNIFCSYETRVLLTTLLSVCSSIYLSICGPSTRQHCLLSPYIHSKPICPSIQRDELARWAPEQRCNMPIQRTTIIGEANVIDMWIERNNEVVMY